MKRRWFDGTPCTFVWIKSSSFTARLSFPPSTFDFLRRQHLVVSSVTRAFYEIFEFFSEIVGKNCENGPNCIKKWIYKYYNEIHFIEFLLINLLDKNLGTFHNCENSGHTLKVIKIQSLFQAFMKVHGFGSQFLSILLA